MALLASATHGVQTQVFASYLASLRARGRFGYQRREGRPERDLLVTRVAQLLQFSCALFVDLDGRRIAPIVQGILGEVDL